MSNSIGRQPAWYGRHAVSAAPRGRKAVGLIGWLVVTAAAGALGAIASIDAARFYGELAQPAWAPPAWLFGPVWTVLYAMMAVAAWTVWKVRGWQGAAASLGLYLAQLVANALWTWLFFAWHQGAWALVDIALLWALVALTAWRFSHVRPAAGALLLPYLAWLGFAAMLNFTLWQMNPQLLGG